MKPSNNQIEIEASVDSILLCLTYASYRQKGYNILFSNLINIYEARCQIQVNRE